MKTLTKTLLCIMILSLLMSTDTFAQKNRNKRKTNKAKTETVLKGQKQESSQKSSKNSYEDKDDNTKYITVIDDDDSNYIPSEEHNTILDEFLNAYNSNGNTLMADSEIERYINSLSNSQKKSFNASVLDRIAPTLENNQYAASLALINLYQSNASKNNKMMPMLYYIKGNIYTTLRDTTGLRQSIVALSQYKDVEDYFEILNKNLASIRNYKPDLMDLEGSWVSDIVNTHYKPNMPLIFFDNYIEGDSLQSVIRKNCPINHLTILNGAQINIGKNFNLQEHISQIIIPYSTDSLFIVWSNEKVSKKSAFVASLLRGGVSTAASHLVGKLNQRHVFSGTTNVLGSLGVTAAEVGVNYLLDELLKPSKKIFVIEARLRIYNSHLMKGKIRLIINKIKPEQDTKTYDFEWKSIFHKWEPDSKIAFSGFPATGVLLPLGLDKESFEKDKTTSYALCSHGSDYNMEMIRQVALYNYWKLNNLGTENLDTLYKKNLKTPFLGIKYENLSQESCKKFNIISGVKILEIFPSSPAHLYGLKKGDIIPVNFDGGNAYHSGDSVNLTYIRGKKEHKINLKLSFPFINRFEKWWGFNYSRRRQGENKIVVTKIDKDSPADKAGLKVDDIIEKINGSSYVVDDNVNIFDKYKPGDELSLVIIRKNKTKTIKFKIISINWDCNIM